MEEFRAQEKELKKHLSDFSEVVDNLPSHNIAGLAQLIASHLPPPVPVGLTEILPNVCNQCGAPGALHWPGCSIADPDDLFFVREGLSAGNTFSKPIRINLSSLNAHTVEIIRGPGTVKLPNQDKILVDQDGNFLGINAESQPFFGGKNPNKDGWSVSLADLPNASLDLQDGMGRIVLPNGDVVTVAKNGEYVVSDNNNNVLFKSQKAYVSTFFRGQEGQVDRYLLTSDSLEEFIKELQNLGITQQQFFEMPIGVFINWLVLKAATRDSEPIPEGVVPLRDHPIVRGLLQSNA